MEVWGLANSPSVVYREDSTPTRAHACGWTKDCHFPRVKFKNSLLIKETTELQETFHVFNLPTTTHQTPPLFRIHCPATTLKASSCFAKFGASEFDMRSVL